jgi:chemotaxis protein methyltransferase CheR
LCKHKEIRIWSAACAAGQEAYSFAMLMDEIKNGGSEKFIYRIFATDHDESQVNKAIKGHYSETDLNNVSLTRVKQWFTKHGETYSIKDELKVNINFTVFDLFSEELRSPVESIFGDFDVVICSNLLFYYNNKYCQVILEKTGRSMARGGYLITGETERRILLQNNYHEVFPQSGIFQKK